MKNIIIAEYTREIDCIKLLLMYKCVKYYGYHAIKFIF